MIVLLEVIIVFLIVAIVALVVNGVEDYSNKRKGVAISFKDSLHQLGIPVVTFTNNGVKLNLLLDTGSDASFIRREILENLDVKSIYNDVAPVSTGGGEICSEGVATLDVSYEGTAFENEFEIANITQIWDRLAEEAGIDIHGILGSEFLKKYGYMIDFKNFVAYYKK